MWNKVKATEDFGGVISITLIGTIDCLCTRANEQYGSNDFQIEHVICR
jgi:hypothetical protein